MSVLYTEFGSHVYGTNIPTSDKDFKAIAIPSAEEILLQQAYRTQTNNTKSGSATKNKSEDIDVETFSLHYWFKLLEQGQTVCYDMLFTPENHWLKHDDVWLEIVANKDKLVNSKISAFAGYCQTQAAKYSLKGSNLSAYRTAANFFKEKHPHARLRDMRDEIKEKLIDTARKDMIYNNKSEPLIKLVTIETRPGATEDYLQVGPKTKVPYNAQAKMAADIFETQYKMYGDRAKQAEDNLGVDWKALMHAVRVCSEAKELLLTGNITFPRPEKDLLLKIRKGELTYREVSDIIVSGLFDLQEAQKKSTLRSEPDLEWIKEFILDNYFCEVFING